MILLVLFIFFEDIAALSIKTEMIDEQRLFLNPLMLNFDYLNKKYENTVEPRNNECQQTNKFYSQKVDFRYCQHK